MTLGETATVQGLSNIIVKIETMNFNPTLTKTDEYIGGYVRKLLEYIDVLQICDAAWCYSA